MSSGGAGAASLGLQGFQGTMVAGQTFAELENQRFQTGFVDEQLRFNEEALKIQAGEARAAGIDRRGRLQDQLQERLRSRTAVRGGSRTLLFSGSHADEYTSDMVISNLDQLEVMRQAEREAFEYEFQANELAMQRKFNTLEGKARRRNTLIAGGMQVLGIGIGAANTASKQGLTKGGGGFHTPDGPQTETPDSLFSSESVPGTTRTRRRGVGQSGRRFK
jgi:hypothetical protein